MAEGKNVLLPHVISDTEMEIWRFIGSEDLQVGPFGILEPTEERFTDYETIDVAIVPGMAFDRQGHRLGRGKGYYDRFLTKIPQTYKIGLCDPSSLLDFIPTDKNDIPDGWSNQLKRISIIACSPTSTFSFFAGSCSIIERLERKAGFDKRTNSVLL